MVKNGENGTKIVYEPLWTSPMDKQRSPTDVKFLKIFSLFCVVWLGIAAYAYTHGNLNELNDIVKDVNLPFGDDNNDAKAPSDDSMNNRFKREISLGESKEFDLKTTSIILIWVGIIVVLGIAAIGLLRCFARAVVCSIISFIFTVLFCVTCAYVIWSAYGSKDKQRVKREILNEESDDVELDDPYFKICSTILQWIGISALLCITYIVLLRWFTKIIVYCVITLFFVSLFSITCMNAAWYVDNQEQVSMIPFVLSTVIFVVFLILFLLNRKKISIACEVIKEASKCVIFFPCSFLFVLLPIITIFGAAIFAGAVHMHLNSIPVVDNNQTLNHIPIFQLFNFFGFLWLGNFVWGFLQMVLAGTFATWFWTQDKKYVPSYALRHFTGAAIKYHLGTLALGSMILQICQVIRILLSTIKKPFEGKWSPCAFCCLGLYESVFGTLERIVTYITQAAYIGCAVHGTEFFMSAKNAFNLLQRNILKCLIINKVTDAILLIGGVLTVGITTLSAKYFITQELHPNSVNMVVASVFISSVCVTALFLTVLRTATDTIFYCVLEDYERNDGSEKRPYYMSFKLRNLFLD